MKGFIKQFATSVACGAALVTVLGCTTYRNLVDPCWPERYNTIARGNVHDMLNAQAAKGHQLDITVWSTHFEKDPKTGDSTAILNESGKSFLRDIARRQPFPDPQLWLEYPYDVKESAKRNQMIVDRKAAVHSFMATETKLVGANFHIEVHDFVQPTYPYEWAGKAYNNIDIQGRLGIGGGAGSSSGSGGGGGR